ncbi:sodium-dependent neutral amino acid transporter B(0)AT2-like [Styela clava]
MDEEENIGTDSAATLVGKGGIQEDPTDKDEDLTEDGKKRSQWDNKIQYLLAQIGFAVGLGNVWRFPYLCQKNGGGAFLIPYLIMMVFEGIPLFYLEIAIGQRLRRGSVGVWNHIHPLLGGVGIASMVVCFFIALYYNVIISWAMFYFLNSFQSLPWANCPEVEDPMTNLSIPVQECDISSETSYFWYRDTLDISPAIEEPGILQWRMVLCLLLAWTVVFFGTFKGIKSSGKVIYFSATFPYLVLLIFFFRAITLEGAVGGLLYMVTPDYSRLKDPEVWRDAATQIFFSLGLGFGGVIAYSSYNDIKNDCRKDALTVSIINSATSIFASIVVFAVLGFKAFSMNEECLDRNIAHVREFFHIHSPSHDLLHVVNVLDRKNYEHLFGYINETIYNNETNLISDWSSFTNTSVTEFSQCSVPEELKKAVSGPGLAFIAFTEAMIRMPGAPFWSVLFFSMLINLGLGSMFGTLEGIITPLKDLGVKIRKELVVGILCVVSFSIGLIFCLQSGMYVLGLFDTYAGTLPLLLIAFFENIAVVYVYGMDKFSQDIELMMGKGPPGWYWKITWYAISPICMAVLFISSLVSLGLKTPSYDVYDKTIGVTQETEYPSWVVAVIVLLITCSVIWIPLIALLRWRNVLPYIQADLQGKKNPKENVFV